MKTDRTNDQRFKGHDPRAPLPSNNKPQRASRAVLVFIVLVILGLLYQTLPPECKTLGGSVPRHCVD